MTKKEYKKIYVSQIDDPPEILCVGAIWINRWGLWFCNQVSIKVKIRHVIPVFCEKVKDTHDLLGGGVYCWPVEACL